MHSARQCDRPCSSTWCTRQQCLVYQCQAVYVASLAPVPDSRSPCAAGFKLEAPPDLEPHIAEALSARRCLPLLAALVHVPAMHAMPLAANAQYGGATSSMGIQVLCHLQSKLVACLQFTLLPVVCSRLELGRNINNRVCGTGAAVCTHLGSPAAVAGSADELQHRPGRLGPPQPGLQCAAGSSGPCCSRTVPCRQSAIRVSAGLFWKAYLACAS